MGGRCRLETEATVVKHPRYRLEVRGASMYVARNGVDARGRAYFEVVDTPRGDDDCEETVQELFPNERGYVKDGTAFRIDRSVDGADSSTGPFGRERVGPVDVAALCVGESLSEITVPEQVNRQR